MSFERLKGRFGSAPFSAREAFAALNGELGYSRNAVYQVLHELAENRLLVRLGRGIYMTAETRVEGWAGLSVEAAVEVASEPLRRAVDVLRGSGVEFMVTGPSVLTRFHHHLPRRLIHLVYVVDGAGEFAVTSLREANLRALLNPGRREVDLALEAFRDGDIFLVREFARLEGSMDGWATLEKAVVDTYFEATRRRIPYSEVEVGRIIARVFREGKVNVTRLLKLAGRRGVREEFKTIVKEVIPVLPFSGGVVDERVERVLRGMRE